ncbi:Uncharacterized protein BM_BM3173 [Brugia malayi]|uniref:Uncharacterized protein n=3 Tax=Brugia TaxID=6278 RepID=A0A4E9FAK8_BRUMA|nr:Uncharacterized protein BM_BM3173 [Brugia malayi]VIO93113.1 Uncharacterized protein BM_BM3173 [Brugia malayi]
MLKLTFLIILCDIIPSSLADANSCGKLVHCTIKRCFSTEKTETAMHTMSAVGMFSAMVDQFSFVCLATKCHDACTACEQCNYALDQISKITSGVKTKMECPKIETCLEQCFIEDALHMNSCARKRCNVYCYDDDCPYCVYVAKRIFLRICRENNIPKLPNVNFNGSCMDLFNYVLKEYSAGRRT